MKFVMSYSCGKDSTLALDKMIRMGHEPVALLVMFNEEAERSFFHGADKALLEAYERALGLSVLAVPTKGAVYHLAMEEALEKAKALGAEAVCFGDIDIEEHRIWGEERCSHVGMKAFFPLWQNDRRENVYEFLERGYQCVLKCINNTLLPERLLGKILDEDAIAVMQECGIDICGENGEYHTLAVNGPIFQKPLEYRVGKVLQFGNYSVVEVDSAV